MKTLRPSFRAGRAALTALSAAAFLGAASFASAALAVSWGGTDYVSANRTFTNLGGFTGGNPDQITVPNYPIGTVNNATFYGKIETFSGTSNILSTVNNSATGDLISLKSSDSTPEDGANNTGFLVLWKQPDFLNGLNTGNVGFTGSTTITTTLTTYASQNADSGRLVIRIGTDYYVSERVFNAANTTFTPAPTALTWYAYNPASAMNVDSPSSPVSIVTDGTIGNVTEIGFYFETSATANAARIQNFDVNMVAIPEPGSICLLGLLAPLALARRRR